MSENDELLADGETGQVSDDDWAAAMAEQGEPEAAAPAQPATSLFPNFGDTAAKGNTLNDFDMILDIPVALTVELDAPRSPSATCCNSPTAPWWNWMAWRASPWMSW